MNDFHTLDYQLSHMHSRKYSAMIHQLEIASEYRLTRTKNTALQLFITGSKFQTCPYYIRRNREISKPFKLKQTLMSLLMQRLGKYIQEVKHLTERIDEARASE